MAIALSAIAMQTPGRVVERTTKAALSGNYTTGGETFDFTSIVENGIDGFKSFSRLPLAAFVVNDVGGYYFELIPGTALTNFKLKGYVPGGTEIPAGAYPGALTTALAANPLLIQSLHKQGV